MMKKTTHLLMITLLLFVTTACGWHLRGSGEEVEIKQSIYVEDATGLVHNALKKSLIKKQRLGDVASADIQLILGDEFYERRSASVNNLAQTIQYQLTLSVPYQILNNLGEPIAEKAVAELSRYYTYNQNAINSSSKEEKALKKEIIRQLSQRILRRVNFISQQQSAKPSRNK
jgi:LPS-assembly lipoprotein